MPVDGKVSSLLLLLANPLSFAIALVSLIGGSVLLALVYNVYFHSLASYPGPKYATCSQFWYIYNSLTGHLPHRMKDLHEKYGEVVRFAPNELSYITAEVWKPIYSTPPSKEYPEIPKDYHFTVPLGTLAITVAPYEGHRRYRKKLSPVFSEKSMREQEPIIKQYIDLLVRQMGNRAGTAINMAAWYNFVTFDIIGDLAFGEPFGCLESGATHSWINFIFPQTKTNMSMQAISRIGSPWLTKLLIPYLVPKSLTERKLGHIKMTAEKLNRRLENKESRKDFMEQLSTGEPTLSFNELLANASTLIVAGSETTATAMSGLTYFLLLNPDKLQKVVHEIRAAFASEDEISMATINRLSYLGICIDEALRLYPPVGFGVPRRVPGKGIMLNGKWVPGNTGVNLNQWAAYRSTLNFRDPESFVPERWTDDPRYAEDNKAVFHPFHIGPRNCVGMNLALTEIRLILSRVFWNFDLEILPDSVDWMKYQKSYQLWEKGELNVKINMRKE